MLEIYALNLNDKKPIYVNQFFWTLKLLLLFKSYEKNPDIQNHQAHLNICPVETNSLGS